MEKGKTKAKAVGAKRGGARPGSGRPRNKTDIKYLDQKLRKKWLDAATRLAKNTGETVEYHLLSMIADPFVQAAVKIPIMRLYVEMISDSAKPEEEAAGGEKEKESPVGLYLPERQEDPAKIIPMKGGK
jgi:hypothetical protein